MGSLTSLTENTTGETCSHSFYSSEALQSTMLPASEVQRVDTASIESFNHLTNPRFFLNDLCENVYLIVGEHGNELRVGIEALKLLNRSDTNRSSYTYTTDGIEIIRIAGTIGSYRISIPESVHKLEQVETLFPDLLKVEYLDLPVNHRFSAKGNLVVKYRDILTRETIFCSRFLDEDMATVYGHKKYSSSPPFPFYEQGRACMLEGYEVRGQLDSAISIHSTTDRTSTMAIVKDLDDFSLAVLSCTSFNKVLIDSSYPPDGFWGSSHFMKNPPEFSNILRLNKCIGLEYFDGDYVNIANDLRRFTEKTIHPNQIEVFRATSVVFPQGIIDKNELTSFISFTNKQRRAINDFSINHLKILLKEIHAIIKNDPLFPLKAWCKPSIEALAQGSLLSFEETMNCERYLNRLLLKGGSNASKACEALQLWSKRMNVFVQRGDVPVFADEISFNKIGLGFLLARKPHLLLDIKQDGTIAATKPLISQKNLLSQQGHCVISN